MFAAPIPSGALSGAADALQKAGQRVQAAGESVVQASTVSESAGRVMPVDSVSSSTLAPNDREGRPGLAEAAVDLLAAETQYKAAAMFTNAVIELGEEPAKDNGLGGSVDVWA
jgi:hypothetical protein